MKKDSTLIAKFKSILFLTITMLYSSSVVSQSDTLHIYYKGLQTAILDSNETKIATWAKSLNGKHMDVQILAYYEKADFKKYSQERSDAMYNVINRKARELITIKFIGPKKGEKSQRSTLDIVYVPTGSSPAVKESPVAEKKEAESKTKEKVATEEKEPKTAKTKEVKPEKVKEKAKEKEAEVAENKEEPKKSSKEKEINTELYRYDSVYVNGELKVTRKKIKQKK